MTSDTPTPSSMTVLRIARQWFTASGGLVAEAAADVDPAAVFRHVAGLPHPLFLDSALVDAADGRQPADASIAAPRLGRYSFGAADRLASFVTGCPRATTDAAGATPPSGPVMPGWAGHPLAGHAGVFASQSPESYREMVGRGVEYVRAGDVFQVNLAQQFAVAGAVDPVDLYLKARAPARRPISSPATTSRRAQRIGPKT